MISDLDDIINKLIRFDQKLRKEHVTLHEGGHYEIKLKLGVVKALVATVEHILAASQNKS